VTSDYFNNVRQLEETVDKDAAAAGAQCNTSLKFAQVSPLLTLADTTNEFASLRSLLRELPTISRIREQVDGMQQSLQSEEA